MNTRICTQCGKEYIHTPALLYGVDMLANCTICEECASKNEKEEQEASRLNSAKAFWAATVPEKYRDTDITHPDFPRSIHEAGKSFLKNKSLPFFGMISDSGKGKTRVAAMMSKKLVWKGEYITWINQYQLAEAARNLYDDKRSGESKNLIEKCRKTKNLVIDDIGQYPATSACISTLYSILEARSGDKLLTIWTSNEGLNQMFIGDNISYEERTRCISRIGGYSQIVSF